MLESIDRQRAMNLLESTVEGRKGFHYDTRDGCKYVQDGQPSCLIAHVLSNAGVSTKLLARLDDLPFASIGYYGVTDILAEEVDITAVAVVILKAAQDQQDQGHSWESALASAYDLYLRIGE